jgi:hypothetical protein
MKKKQLIEKKTEQNLGFNQKTKLFLNESYGQLKNFPHFLLFRIRTLGPGNSEALRLISVQETVTLRKEI